MPGGNKNIKPSDGKQFSSTYQPSEKWTEKKAIQLGDDLIVWLKEKDEDGNDKGNIFVKDFLVIENSYGGQLVDYLKKKFSSFSELHARAKEIQEMKLVKFGVGDRLNASMTKFVLTNHHGYSERVEQNQSGEKPIIQLLMKDVQTNNGSNEDIEP